MINAIDLSVNLLSDNTDPFKNLLNSGPFLILDIYNHFCSVATGQYNELLKWGIALTIPSPN